MPWKKRYPREPMRLERWQWVLLLGFVVGCDNESTVVRGESCFDACISASADFELEAQLEAVAGLRESLESGRLGLAAYANVTQALRGFVQSMADLNPKAPDGLSYEGKGLYSLRPNADTRLELRFYQPKNTSFGIAGDLIDFDLFDVGNYFVGFGVKTSASIGLSGISTDVAFTFDAAGPGAELLGLAAGVNGPVGVDVDAFTRQLSNVIVHANVSVSHRDDDSSFAFSLAPESRRIGSIADATIPLRLTDFTASASAGVQSLALTSSALAMAKSGGAFDGTVRLASTSPDFAFDMLFYFDMSASADVLLGCPDAPLSADPAAPADPAVPAPALPPVPDMAPVPAPAASLEPALPAWPPIG